MAAAQIVRRKNKPWLGMEISMAEYAECLAVIREVLTPHLPPGEKVGEDEGMMAELGLSSLQMLEVVSEVEDRLDVSLPLNQLPNVQTVREFAELCVAACDD